MPPFPVSLDGLIDYVRDSHPDGDPLEHLADAVMAASQLEEESDALIGYFVDQARSSGASWSQIGAAMGVSKQAAQKRFVARDDDAGPEGKAFSRFTPRARFALAAAGKLAAGQDIDVTHVAAGALFDSNGLAAGAVRRLEVSPDELYEAIGVGPAALEGDPGLTSLRQLKFTDPGKAALHEAFKAALRLGHNYVGTEHLLLGAVAAPGDLSERLSAIGLPASVIDSAIAVELAEAQLQRRRRAG